MRNTVRGKGRPEHEILGQLLRQHREASGFSQRYVANQLGGRTQSFVWKVEQGIQHIDIATLLDYTAVLSIDPAELMRELKSRL